MQVGDRTIQQCLTKQGYLDSAWNIRTIRDGLEWEDREDYENTQDAVNAVIEDYIDMLRQ